MKYILSIILSLLGFSLFSQIGGGINSGFTNQDKDIIHGCLFKSDGTYCQGTIIVSYVNKKETFKFYQDGLEIDPSDVLEWESGGCNDDRNFISTTFTPDQYAIVWTINGSREILSYDRATDTWTNYGACADNRSYALAFFNDVSKPTAYYQGDGGLYSFSPDDPCGTQQFIGPTLPDAPSSYPCFDYDPSGRLLAGIGSGSSVIEIDPLTGEANNIGTLLDVRYDPPIPLSAGPGDWFFDPNGNWYMMAKDNRGGDFGLCEGTVLWQINPSTLEVVRVSDSCSPVGGTGATWLAAGKYGLSTGAGQVYEYNEYTDTWTLFTTAPEGINDLASQWIIPDCIELFGWSKTDCENPDECDLTLWQLVNDPNTGETLCEPYESLLTGKYAGDCQKEGNPYVSDPSSEDIEYLSDQVWHKGCSDEGSTLWRVSYDPAGNEIYEYWFKGLDNIQTVTEAPTGFCRIPCDEIPLTECETTQWCNLDNTPNTSVYRKECNDGSITWYDETGTIAEPIDKQVGECQDIDPLLPVTEQVICFNDITYVRLVKEQYTENSDGLPELANYQIIWYNEDGTFYDSGLLNPDDEANEPGSYQLGDCASEYIDFRVETLCEKDDEKLLLVDSGGAFAEYSFADGSVTNISTLQVPSAGSGADPDNFLLYAVTSSGELQTVDVNTKQTLNTVPLFTNDGSPLNFSAAHYYDGWLYAAAAPNWTVYRINITTAEVSYYNGAWTGISGSGTSMAINPLDGKFYITGSLGRVYEIGNTAGDSGVATLVYDSPGNTANGATFDTNGNLYLTGGDNTYQISNFGTSAQSETNIIDNWTPGANSITYYKTEAQQPSCFYRRYGVLEDGTWEYLSDHFVSDFSERVISGAVDCCTSTGGSSGGTSTITNFPDVQDIEETPICIGGVKKAIRVKTVQNDGSILVTYEDETGLISEPSTWNFGYCDCETFTYFQVNGITGTLRNREWHNTFPSPGVAGSTTEAGRDARLNHDFSLPTTTDNTRNNLNLDDTNNTAGLTDVQVVEGFIVASQQMLLRYTNASEGYWAVELGQCCSDLELLGEIGGQGKILEFTIPEGIHAIRLWNIDTGGTNSAATTQYSTDGGLTWTTDATPPNIDISQEKPNEQCLKGYLCDGVYYELDKSTTITDPKLCPIECVQSSSSQSNLQTLEIQN